MVPTFESEPASSRNFGVHAVVFRDAERGSMGRCSNASHRPQNPVKESAGPAKLIVFLPSPLPISPPVPLQSSSAPAVRVRFHSWIPPSSARWRCLTFPWPLSASASGVPRTEDCQPLRVYFAGGVCATAAGAVVLMEGIRGRSIPRLDLLNEDWDACVARWPRAV
jgi:hypothetical protein